VILAGGAYNAWMRVNGALEVVVAQVAVLVVS
jgi:hypothetical protein